MKTLLNALSTKTKEDINKHIKSWDAEQWDVKVMGKTSLQIYSDRASKKQHITTRKNCHQNEMTRCSLCEEHDTDLSLCSALQQTDRLEEENYLPSCNAHTKKTNAKWPLSPRRPSTHTTHHEEDKQEMLTEFLFDMNQNDEEMERRKEWLYQLWQARQDNDWKN